MVVVIGIAGASGLANLALRWEVHRIVTRRWQPVPATNNGVIFVNPKSGDGKAMRLGLADETRRLGIRTVMLERGDDLRALAEKAVEEGDSGYGRR